MTLASCLTRRFGPVWVCSRGYRLMSVLLGDGPIAVCSDGYPPHPASCGQSGLYTLLSLLPPPSFLQGFLFPSAESNSVFIYFLFTTFFSSHRLLESPSSRAALSIVHFCRTFQLLFHIDFWHQADMGNLIWHEYSRLVAITASVCEFLPLPRIIG